jgi:hypothetical protein
MNPPPSAAQARFLGHPGREALYAAPGGGGNTTALVLACLAHAHVSGYTALLLCRSPRRLGALADQVAALAPQASWDPEARTFRLPSGATIRVGALEKACSVREYGMQLFNFVGYDRVLEFLDEQYAGMSHRAVSLGGTPVRARVRASGDPEGANRAWVDRRFGPDARVVAGPDDCPWLPPEDRAALAADPSLRW